MCERGRAVEAWHCIADQQMRETRRLQESAGMADSRDKYRGIPSSVCVKPVEDIQTSLEDMLQKEWSSFSVLDKVYYKWH